MEERAETITASQAIVDVLRAEGVRHVFGLPGAHVLGIYDALHAAPEVRHILVCYEQAAASLAAASTQLTGEPGCAWSVAARARARTPPAPDARCLRWVASRGRSWW